MHNNVVNSDDIANNAAVAFNTIPLALIMNFNVIDKHKSSGSKANGYLDLDVGDETVSLR